MIELKPTTTSDQDLEIYTMLEKSAIDNYKYSGITEKEEAREEIERAHTFFILNENNIIGNISYEIKEPGHVYLSGFIILPQYQGKGIGKEAMRQIMEMDKVKSAKLVDLVTHPHNSNAIKLYLSFGFQIVGWADNFFGDGEPRIIMQKTSMAT